MRQYSRQIALWSTFVAATLVTDLDPAAARTDRAIEPQPTAQDFYDRGIAERKSGRTDAAIVLLSLAAAREPGNADIRLQLALAFMSAKRIDAAERQLHRAQRLAPGFVEVDIALAYIDLFQGRKLDAQMRTQRLLQKYAEREDVIALASQFRRLPVSAEFKDARTVGMRLTRFDGSIAHVNRQRPLHDRPSGSFLLSYRFQPS
jgi:tetratricopeptide (TPR) repeat protein